MSSLRPLRILVVEDEGLIAMDIETTIEDEGHVSVGCAQTAGEAIRLFEETNPDVVFLDVHLRGTATGMDVAETLRGRPGARYMFMTANATVLTGDMIGGIGVVQKPVAYTSLVEVLRYLQEGVLDPPPSSPKPRALRLSPDYVSAWV